MSVRVPLNGIKTHPLSDYALEVLWSLHTGPAPVQRVNPGAVNRLLREDLVELVDRPSPYPSHKGRAIPHLKITTAGLTASSKGSRS